MIRLVLIFVSVTITICSCSGQDLDNYRWKNRLVLLFCDSLTASPLQQQSILLTQSPAEVTDRDLKIFKFSPRGGLGPDGAVLSADFCKVQFKQWSINTSGFHLLLIGKDGGVKMKKSEPIEGKVIFDLIDTMPMRQYEMRKKN